MRSTSLKISAIAHDSSLRRGLSSTHVIAIVVSSVIGTGIFIRSASMIQDVGAAPLLVVAWILGGLLSLAGALSYAELSTLMPRAGGEYVFLREAFGRPVAFLFGWMRFVVGAGIPAAIAVGVATFLADAFSLSGPWSQTSLRIFQLQLQLDWGPRQIIALSSVGILAALNCRDVRASGTTQSMFAGFEIAVLLVIIVAALLVTYSRAAGRPEPATSVTTLLGGFDRLSNMAIFGCYLFYCCNVLALMVLRRRWSDAERPFAVPGYPWIPLAFLIASLAMLAATIIRGAPEVIWALALLTLGLPAYLLFRRIYSPAAGSPPAVA